MLLPTSDIWPLPDNEEVMTNSENSVSVTEVAMAQVPPTQVKVTPLLTQVAGHQYDKDRKIGILSLGSQLVLKALQDPPRGTRELTFYQEVFSADSADEDVLALRQFLPTFHGTVDMDSAKFLKLENLSAQQRRPCVVDLKMGKITYDPYATPEKIRDQVNKCPSAAILGFQVSGMMIYNVETDSYDRMDKVTSHKLTTDNMLTEGIGKFFGLPRSLRKDAVNGVLSRLQEIENWFSKQRRYHFFSSSLLLVYEGCPKHQNQDACQSLSTGVNADCTDTATDTDAHNCHMHVTSTGVNADCTDTGTDAHNCHMHVTSTGDPSQVYSSDDVVVKMIDFAHVFPTTEMDCNYLDGLRNLIQHLKQLLELDDVGVV